MIMGIISCSGEDTSQDTHPKFIRGEDGKVGTFSYNGYVNFLEWNGGYRGDPNDFKNTIEMKVKTKEDVVELAMNEVTREYDKIDVYYDKSTHMWAIIFYYDITFGGDQQSIFIDNNGITQLIKYGGASKITDGDVTVFTYYDLLEDLEDWVKRTKGKWVDPSDFQNTNETEIKSKEDVIKLAEKELLVDYIEEMYIYYDRENLMWMFRCYLKNNKLQHIFIDNTGITKYIAHNIVKS